MTFTESCIFAEKCTCYAPTATHLTFAPCTYKESAHKHLMIHIYAHTYTQG